MVGSKSLEFPTLRSLSGFLNKAFYCRCSTGLRKQNANTFGADRGSLVVIGLDDVLISPSRI